MTAIAKAPALTLPSEITEPGWYWAEERIVNAEPLGQPYCYHIVVIRADKDSNGAIWFECGDNSYGDTVADAWFRIIRRIEEPELRGGWA